MCFLPFLKPIRGLPARLPVVPLEIADFREQNQPLIFMGGPLYPFQGDVNLYPPAGAPAGAADPPGLSPFPTSLPEEF